MTHLRIVTPPSRTRRETSIGWSSLDDEPIDGNDPRNLRILEAAFHEAALAYSEDPHTTPEDDAAIAELTAFVAELTRRP
jgi:hypothetical protein